MIEKGDWEAEIVKRTGEGFNKDVFTDLMIPLAFNGFWALMTINYEARRVRIVYFQKEVEKLQLKLLSKAADFMWREGGRMGLKCAAGVYLQERVKDLEWKTEYIACCKDAEERVEKLSFKRMLTLMYEITCKEPRSVDSVTDWMAEMMRKDNGTTKMILAEI
jgi:hypothetical protein